MRRTPLLALLAVISLAPWARAQTAPPPASPPAAGPTVKLVPLAPEVKQKVLDGLQDVIVNKAFVPNVDFKKWPDYVAKHKDDLDKADSEAAFVRVLNQTLREFGVSHIVLRAPRAAQARVRTSMVGFGINVRKVDEGLNIVNISDDSPAVAAGLKVGDVITQIDGSAANDPAQLRVDTDATPPSSGPSSPPAPSKSIALKVKSADGSTKDVTLQAKSISTLRPPMLTWFNPDTAVLKIVSFTQTGYDRQMIEKEVAEAQKAKYLIIDLRNDGGGAVRNLSHLLGLLLPEGTEYGMMVRRTTFDDYLKEKNAATADLMDVAKWDKNKSKALAPRGWTNGPFKGKIAVLINRGSASASEICAAALHDTGGAILVGQASRGAVLASVYARLEGGFELQYPLSDYVTIKNERLEGKPRQPDVAVDARPEEGKPDPVVQAAYDKLKGG